MIPALGAVDRNLGLSVPAPVPGWQRGYTNFIFQFHSTYLFKKSTHDWLLCYVAVGLHTNLEDYVV